MKSSFFALLLISCAVNAQVSTKITYTIPQGATSGITILTSENDKPVLDGQLGAGTHEITVQTNGPASGFMYVAAAKRFFPFKLDGTPVDLTNRLSLSGTDDNGEMMGAGTPDIFPVILQRFLDVTASLKSLSYIPDHITDSLSARKQVKDYYAYLQGMIAFTDSVVTLYPKDNASLFTMARLAHWCSYSPEVYTIFNKLDPSLRKSDFGAQILSVKTAMVSDSVANTGKKPGMGLQLVLNDAKLNASGAHNRLIVFWNENTHLDNDLIDDIKRLHLLYGGKALQVNFVYTGTNKNWMPMIKQPGMPVFANYVHCASADQLGSIPVITASDYTCLTSGVRGYNLYKKMAQL